MRLTAFILFICCMQVSATGLGQKITLSLKNAPLTRVFEEISKQAGISVVYKEALMATAKPVTIEVREAAIDQVLAECLKGQPFSYRIENGMVVIQASRPPAVQVADSSLIPYPPGKIEVKGIVYNESGQPLSGANVTIKTTGKGTITNAKGEFDLPAVPAGSPLVISFIGYAPQTIKITAGRTLQVYLSIAKNDLDKVVIQAYGTTSRRLTTSDIAVVTNEEIEKQPVMNPILALQGRVAGLEVTQTSGFASAPVKVELRGRNFISDQFTSDPLYIIDGVPLTVLELGGSTTYNSGSYGFLQAGVAGPAHGQSPFFNLNPSDIESIEVYKDADATAIYGSRAANGVILITTKKGKPGKTHLDLHVNGGVNKITRYWQMMSLPQYLAMRREAYRNDGAAPGLSTGAYDLYQWDTTRSTNWQKALFGGTGKNIDVQAGLTGGDIHTTFRISAGYTRSTNILTISGADQRGSLSISISHQSADHRLNISVSSGYSFTQSDMINLPAGAILLPPDAPSIYDSAGNLNYHGWGENNTTARSAFPFAGLLDPYTAKTNLLNSNLELSYEPMRGLKISAGLGYNNALADQKFFTTIASQDPLSNATGSAQFGDTKNSNWIIEPQATYDAAILGGKLNIMVGGSMQQVNTDGTQLYGVGYTTDELLRTISNAPTQYSFDSYGVYKYAAFFGRVNYTWKNKYIINLNVRRDGSSRFGAGKQFGNFGSVGAAWIFTEENWFKDKLGFLSFGKLRGSYGITGSDAIGEYGYLSRWTSTGTVPYGGAQPLYPTQHADPDYHWQKVNKLEGAIDLGFMKDMIHISVVYYRDRCDDQLVMFPTPVFSGFSSVVANSPALVQNSGLEFTGNAKIVDTKNFAWSVSFNLAANRNKLVAYPDFSQSPYYNSLVIGKPLNIRKLLHYIGVNPQTGDYSFEDKDHDGQLTNADTYVYDLTPKFFGGMGMNLRYHDLELSLFFNVKDQIGTNAYFRSGSNFGTPVNSPAEIVGKEWRNPGDMAVISRFTRFPNNSLSGNSDLAYTDASFIRLSTLALSYTLPSNYMKKAGIESCSLYIHTNNLFTITRYKGLDPETQNFGVIPPSRVLVGGISFNF